MDSYQQTNRPGGSTLPPGRTDPLGGDPPRGVDPLTSPEGANCAPPEGRDGRSLGDLIKQLRDESATLIRQEVALAKTEMGEKASRYGKDATAVAIGAGVAMIGALALLTAVAYALAALLNLGLEVRWPNALWISWGLIGLVTAITGYILLNRGLSDLKRQSPVPEKTVQSLKEDQQWLANKTH